MTIQEFISTDPENLIKTSLITKLTNAEKISYIYNLLDKDELRHYNLEYIVERSSNNSSLINCKIVHKHSTLCFLKNVNIGRKKYLGLKNGIYSISIPPSHGGYYSCVYVGLNPTSINQGIHIKLVSSDGRLDINSLKDDFLDIIEKLNQFISKNSELFERIDNITKNVEIKKEEETYYRLFFLLSQAKLQNLENYLTEDTLLGLTDSVFWGNVSLKYAGYKRDTERSTIIDEQLKIQSLRSYNVRLSSNNYILNYPVKLWKDILDKVSDVSKNNLEECKPKLKKAIKLLKKAEEAEKEFYEFVYGPIPETENCCPWNFRRDMLINRILHTLNIKGSPLLSKDEQTLRKYFKTVDH
jgi:hypothetical protein